MSEQWNTSSYGAGVRSSSSTTDSPTTCTRLYWKEKVKQEKMIMKTKVAVMTIIVEDPVPVYARYPHANAFITPAGRAGSLRLEFKSRTVGHKRQQKWCCITGQPAYGSEQNWKMRIPAPRTVRWAGLLCERFGIGLAKTLLWKWHLHQRAYWYKQRLP